MLFGTSWEIGEVFPLSPGKKKKEVFFWGVWVLRKYTNKSIGARGEEGKKRGRGGEVNKQRGLGKGVPGRRGKGIKKDPIGGKKKRK
ncbi:MAG: hypothetical protein IPH31_08680 [Lewinellaceae bacterium]|nr:hypothetical protein [Lewinellaceae bacterium]